MGALVSRNRNRNDLGFKMGFLCHLGGFWECVYKTESRLGKENGSGDFADSNWEGEKL